ncbi:DHS-like NAD/FAD-binding domain-containing protein, partial [Pluteus cervinus]
LSLMVQHSKKIVVASGAGISCSSGIPDFRSENGIFSQVKQLFPNLPGTGRSFFDATVLQDQGMKSAFYRFMATLKRAVDAAPPSPTHEFIKTLDDGGKLLRCYTQNIDGLEKKAGLSMSDDLQDDASRVVQLHAGLHTVRCTVCCTRYEWTAEYQTLFLEGQAPDCPDCLSRAAGRGVDTRRPITVGSLRPAVVLYNEDTSSADEIGRIWAKDMKKQPDLLIIMGTSMKVEAFNRLVKDFAKAVHASPNKRAGKVILINKTPPKGQWHSIIDYHVLGETDDWVKRVSADW